MFAIVSPTRNISYNSKSWRKLKWISNGFMMFLTLYFLFNFPQSLPILMINGSDKPYDGFSVLDYVCIVAFALAVVIEVTADVQKAIWVKKGREGVFCTTGVWGFSRHPNYFGEVRYLHSETFNLFYPIFSSNKYLSTIFRFFSGGPPLVSLSDQEQDGAMPSGGLLSSPHLLQCRFYSILELPV